MFASQKINFESPDKYWLMLLYILNNILGELPTRTTERIFNSITIFNTQKYCDNQYVKQTINRI